MNATQQHEAARLLDDMGQTCEYRSEDGVMRCSTEAAWLLRVSCGDSAFFCESHRGRLAGDLQRGEALYCAGHDGRRVLYDWVAI